LGAMFASKYARLTENARKQGLRISNGMSLGRK
jgi:hypothetical protein